jgi:condensin complex subunit 1
MVITHLCLNDMLKLKGEIVDICMLLEDEDDRIRDQVKLFLHELNSKGNNIIYNQFPQAIARLSKEFADLKVEDFENIAKELVQYIKLDSHTGHVLIQMCQKLKEES